MPDIFHRVGIKSQSPANVYAAVTTIEGLQNWWTTNTEGDTAVGDVIKFRFAGGGFDMRVEQLDTGKRVVWRVLDGPTEWIDTEISWDLSQEDDYTIVRFEHTGWREADDFMCHCSTKWAVFLLSLKSLIETGSGSPWPHDMKIDNTDR
jgi:uncharacterized protein YndB with AHSA1/START domain